MPGSTPILGIPYPLVNETVDPAVFASFANAVNAAIIATQATATFELTGKPTFYGSPPFVAVGPGTNVLTYQNPPAVDNNSFFVAGTPDRLFINRSGVYFIVISRFNIAGYTTMASMFIDVLYNGATVLAKSSTFGSPGSAEVDCNLTLLWPLSAGDFIQPRWNWAGTGTAGPFATTISLMYVCPLV